MLSKVYFVSGRPSSVRSWPNHVTTRIRRYAVWLPGSWDHISNPHLLTQSWPPKNTKLIQSNHLSIQFRTSVFRGPFLFIECLIACGSFARGAPPLATCVGWITCLWIPLHFEKRQKHTPKVVVISVPLFLHMAGELWGLSLVWHS